VCHRACQCDQRQDAVSGAPGARRLVTQPLNRLRGNQRDSGDRRRLRVPPPSGQTSLRVRQPLLCGRQQSPGKAEEPQVYSAAAGAATPQPRQQPTAAGARGSREDLVAAADQEAKATLLRLRRSTGCPRGLGPVWGARENPPHVAAGHLRPRGGHLRPPRARRVSSGRLV